MTRWTVYIVRCAGGSLYTGITTDLNRRISEHNHDNKRGAIYTRGRRPVTLAYQESCKNRSLAAKREIQIKKMGRDSKEILVQSGKLLKSGKRHGK